MKIKYPQTPRANSKTHYFGTEVATPYKWLEDDNSKETKNWINAQNQVTFAYLKKIPYREKLAQKIRKLWNYERINAPSRHGDYFYFRKNNGLQNQDLIYRFPIHQSPEEAEIFLNPNTFSEDNTTSLDIMSFSENGKILAYTISEGGSDWRKVILIDTETKKGIEAPLDNVKFSGISWKGNRGFYYSGYDKPKGSQLTEYTDQHKLYYHKLGTPQNEDQLIFGGREREKYRYVGGEVTEDQRFLIISAANATSGNDLHLQDLTKKKRYTQSIIKNKEANTSLLAHHGEQFFFHTDLNAPNGKVVVVPDKQPEVQNWQDFIPETQNVLEVTTANTFIFAHYMKDARSQVIQFDFDGKRTRQVELPGSGTIVGFSAQKEETEIYYTFTNYIQPATIYKFDLKAGESTLFHRPGLHFNSGEYLSKQVFYTSKDGTSIPMTLTYKKNTILNGKNPTILYGYGGFNISLTPSFSVINAVWLELGGIYAVPNLRGGGEYGQEWHKAGTKLQKQNVFDDFIAAAEYLIEHRYTSKKYLAIRGGSNGGLLVGATMTQRPDLVSVALPAVGVMDMLRYNKFTAGAGWAYDYGTAEESKAMFSYLLHYSPVHNVKMGTSYPATLITTGDHDDRVVPAHSFKFAAQLQAKQRGKAPILIRISTNAGHGAGKPTTMLIREYADIYAFTLYNMGYQKLPQK